MKPPINTSRLLERFLRYVQIETTANPDAQSYPSSPGQLELGKILLTELMAMGLDEVEQDDHGLVWATIPASVVGPTPTILLNAHLDTSPDASGRRVKPQVVESYAGGDIPLSPSGQIIRASECQALEGLRGHCLVTTDGTTLLGGDDKAGVAAIMELAHHLVEYPHLPHGPVRILFTCDEEIGHGTQYVDLAKVKAVAGYTLDGSGARVIEGENFSADLLTVQAIGKVIHPSIAKGRMVNAVRGLSMLLAELPRDNMSPESTCDREGFMHPYSIRGDVARAEAKLLLRDFETAKLQSYATLVKEKADLVARQIPGIEFDIQQTRQYRNMADYMQDSPQVIKLAQLAHERLGHPAKLDIIRGGTDGAMLTERGLRTPNLSVGQHNIHSVLEFVSLNEIAVAVEHLVELLELWQAHGRT